MNKLFVSTIILSTLILSGCANTYVRQHPQLSNELKNINSVAIIPPEVIIQKMNFDGGNERLKEREDTVKNKILEIANAKLSEKGFKVIEFDFHTEIEKDEEFAFSIHQVREAFSEAKKTLYIEEYNMNDSESDSDNDDFDTKPAESLVKEGSEQTASESAPDHSVLTASIGSLANIISEKTGADAIFLINYQGIKKSDGSIVKDMAASVVLAIFTGVVTTSATASSRTEVALIDGSSGDVLWSNIQNATTIGTSVASGAMNAIPNNISN